jgi:hypothetical protein
MLKEWGKTRTDQLTIQESPLNSSELAETQTMVAATVPVITA